MSSARIRVGPFTVELVAGEWRSPEMPLLAERCQALSRVFAPSGGDPEPDRSEALYVAEQLGGQLVSYRRPAADKREPRGLRVWGAA